MNNASSPTAARSQATSRTTTSSRPRRPTTPRGRSRPCAKRGGSAVARARVLVGGERQLAFFPEFGGERIVLKGNVSQTVERVAELADEHNVCVLASGDPMFFGIGSLVVAKCGSEHVEVIPQPSSVAWAFARAGIKSDDAAFVSLHGRPREGLLTR